MRALSSSNHLLSPLEAARQRKDGESSPPRFGGAVPPVPGGESPPAGGGIPAEKGNMTDERTDVWHGIMDGTAALAQPGESAS